MDATIVISVSITNCEAKLRAFCEHDAYRGYDRIGSINNTLTWNELAAVNYPMLAHTRRSAWERFIAPNAIPYLSEVPTNIDLIDSSDEDYDIGRECMKRVYTALTSTSYITDMAASKVCYLKRPKLVAISDSYVRDVLGVSRSFTTSPGASRGERFASRGIAVMDAVRRIGRLNSDPLQRLYDFARTLTIDEEQVQLSKSRILDILIWVETAIRRGHRFWVRFATLML